MPMQQFHTSALVLLTFLCLKFMLFLLCKKFKISLYSQTRLGVIKKKSSIQIEGSRVWQGGGMERREIGRGKEWKRCQNINKTYPSHEKKGQLYHVIIMMPNVKML